MDKELQRHIDDFIIEFTNVPFVKQFLLIKKQLETSQEIKLLQENLKKSQKEMALSLGTSKYEENKKKYLSYKEEYDNHPLVVNYNVLQEEVNYLLEELKDKLK